tara:strand:+ start:3563 stop:5239 length:1677 start_codon:yes stop_codon:yes gene_type:complete
MKVPTYKQQTGFGIRGGGGRRITASMDLNAASAIDRAIGDIGDDFTEIYMRKLDIEADTEVDTAKKAIIADFEEEKSKALQNQNPIQAETEAKGKMRQILKQYQMGLKINPVTGKPFLSSKKSQSRFMSVGQEVYSAAIIDYVKKNNTRIIEVNKANISSSTDEAIVGIVNSNDKKVQAENFKKVFSTDAKEPGILLKSLINGSFTTAKEYTTAVDVSVEKLVDGLVTNILKNAPDASVAAMEIVDGKSENTVLNNAMKMVDKQDALTKRILALGDKIDKNREEEKKKTDDEDAAIIKKRFKSIINADIDNPSQRSAAIAAHRIHISEGAYETLAQREAVEEFLGIGDSDDDNGLTKSDKTAVETLTILDSRNQLTMAAIKTLKPKLTTNEYKAAIKAFIKEQDDGYKKALDMLKDATRYNENMDVYSIAGEATKSLYIDGKKALDTFVKDRRKKKETADIPFNDFIDAMDDIIKAKDEDFRKVMRDALYRHLDTLTAATYKPSFGGKTFAYDLAKPIKSARDFVTSSGARADDPTIQALEVQLKMFEKFNIDALGTN